MATIKNERDLLLQMDSPRFTPIPIQIAEVAGLTTALAGLSTAITVAEKKLEITASAISFVGAAGAATTPTNITLTAVRKNGLTGTVNWVVESGTATLTPSGGTNNTCTISGASIVGTNVRIRARVNDSGRDYDARIIIGKYSSFAIQSLIDLGSQITGKLANSKVDGLGALALLPNVNLATAQVVGDLAADRIGVGTLAAGVVYAGTIHTNQIAAGTLAAGVIYAGEINADNITSGTITGRTIRTAASGARYELEGVSLKGYNSFGLARIQLNLAAGQIFAVSNDNTTAIWGAASDTGTGAGVQGSGNLGPGIKAESTNSVGGYFIGGSSKAPIRLEPSGAYPSPRVAGDIAYVGGWLCFCNGTHWFKSNGEQVT